LLLGEVEFGAGPLEPIGDGHGLDLRLLRGVAELACERVDCIAVLNDGYAVDGPSPR
jgi:hypothetical protein